MKLFYYAQAINEIVEAGNYYEGQRRGLGRQFDAALDAGLERILEAPERWPHQTQRIQRYRLHRFPYVIYYRLDPDAVRVIAVAHTSRRPNYWMDRL